jgi:hypothetical protein
MVLRRSYCGEKQFRVTLIRPRQDFGDQQSFARMVGIDHIENLSLLLFDLGTIAIISDVQGEICWSATLYLLDVARRSRSVTGDTVRTYAESLLVLLRYVSTKKLLVTELTEERWGLTALSCLEARHTTQLLPPICILRPRQIF